MKLLISLLFIFLSAMNGRSQEVPSIYNLLYNEYYASTESLEKIVCGDNLNATIEDMPGNNYSLALVNTDTTVALCTLKKFLLGDFIFSGEFNAEMENEENGFGFIFGLRDSVHYYYTRFLYEANNDLYFQVLLINGESQKTLSEGIIERTNDDGWDKIALVRDIVTTEIKLFINYMEIPVETIIDRIFILGSVGYKVEPSVKLYVDNVKIWGPTVLDKIE
jgi:uncharacterized protein with HEPN domain